MLLLLSSLLLALVLALPLLWFSDPSFLYSTPKLTTIPALQPKISPLGDLGGALLFYARTKTFHP